MDYLKQNITVTGSIKLATILCLTSNHSRHIITTIFKCIITIIYKACSVYTLRLFGQFSFSVFILFVHVHRNFGNRTTHLISDLFRIEEITCIIKDFIYLCYLYYLSLLICVLHIRKYTAIIHPDLCQASVRFSLCLCFIRNFFSFVRNLHHIEKSSGIFIFINI